ncbi:MAG: 50S ribosomal protein L15 [Candidatus Moranbacteria bacterium]|nr:50S ribosomal protein L15 [Candidatus Moranbacteria bacterium]
MQIHQLKIGKRKARKRVGRGGKRGTYSGRGMKGQKSRSGAKINPLFEGGRSSLIERLKKMPGFKSPHPKKININLNDLERNFKNGETVSIENLVKIGLVGKIIARNGIKILGDGKLTKKLSIDKGILMSKLAKKAIEKAGGKIIN